MGPSFYAHGGSPWAYMLTMGGLIASVGAFLVVFSVIGGMHFITLENVSDDTDGMSLSAVANNNSSKFTIEDDDFGVTGSYAAFGGYVGALLAVPLAVVTGLRRRVGAAPPGAAPQIGSGWPQTVTGLVAGLLLLWIFMAITNDLPLLDIKPAGGAYLGVVGYGAIVVGAFPWRPPARDRPGVLNAH